MKKKAYVRNQIRTISKTRARFLSIFCIVFLGASFFAGLRHSPLIMKESMHQYLVEYKWNDLNYIGTLGFDESLIDKVREVDEVEDVDYGFRFDGLMSYEDAGNIGVTLFSDDDFESGVDLCELVEGRLPDKDDECLIDKLYFETKEMELGQEISVKNDNGTKVYTIVGTANDTRYFCDFDRGTNSLGNGNNEAFLLVLTKGNENMAVPEDLFDLHDGKTIYNDLRVRLKNEDDLYEFDSNYDDYIEPVNKEIKAIFSDYYSSLYNDIKDEAQKEIDDGQKEYDDGLLEYNEGMEAYEDGLRQYNDGYNQYLDGLSQYEDGLRQYNDGYSQYQDGLSQYEEGYNQYLSGLSQYQNGLAQYESGLATWQSQYDSVEAGLNMAGGYDQALSIVAYYESMGLIDDPDYIQLKTLVEGYDTLMSAKEELDANKIVLDQSAATLAQSEAQFASSKAVLDATGNTLASSKRELDEAKRQLDETEVLLRDTKVQLDDSLVVLNDAKVQLDDALVQLEDAREQIDDLIEGEAVALTKDESYAIVSFSGNCDSINALSILFPALFFLVAALVSMTTMTRMVEELRTQNGTFRALGYGKKDVIMQYMIYAFLATFFACCIGIFFGTYFFPPIIYSLYRNMMFDVGAPTRVVFETATCIQTYAISVVVILLVTFMVCYKELSEVPAQILRPKAPKLGKRILLERIDIIWKRLSFNQKVTMRNIFRYKKRFFMSIIGIAGCTALIVVGFGIKRSVSPLADIQYGQMWTYDGVITYMDDLSDEDAASVRADFKARDEVKSSMGIYTKNITVGTQNANIEIPADSKEFSNYIHLLDPETEKEMELGDDGVYINKKLSELLDVKEGDTITIELDGDDYDVEIAGIYKLYFRHYIYLSDVYYKEITGEDIEFNSEYFVLNDDVDEDVLLNYCNQNNNVSSLNYVSGIAESFVNQMDSLNSVVIILILCAGALAFIVLYNLTNINIQERKSEIATIKVLGFYPKEVYDYVFRENIMLAFIGSICGLGLGTLIHAYLIHTVEVDMAMFIRSVHYSCYLYAIVLTMAFTFFINLTMRRVLRKIDMVESLKSIE